jgi:hypothetical protein
MWEALVGGLHFQVGPGKETLSEKQPKSKRAGSVIPDRALASKAQSPKFKIQYCTQTNKTPKNKTKEEGYKTWG